jgi:phosphoenolpyruvate carboxykinase (ATP)
MSEAVVEQAVVHTDLSRQELVQEIIRRNEGQLSTNQAIAVTTGERTGRSPRDRFIVEDALTQLTIDWGTVNQPISTESFQQLWHKAELFISTRERYVAHLRVGEDRDFTVPVRVTTEYAWHSLFVKNLFIDYSGQFSAETHAWEMLNVPSMKTSQADGVASDGCVIINFSERRILLCGMRYAGEMKKSMFSVLNYLLPEHDVLPMHCAANRSAAGEVALFFGLSGTGKTTLSADPERFLIGDDEHGWSQQGVFNFEGGCYAKCIDLSAEREPVIYDAIRNGAIMENVVLKNGKPDYADDSLTQNTRAAYPRSHIEKRVPENAATIPNAVLFLTCDLYGVLPPVARLNKEQAAYYFLSGYTALVGSTEVGQSAGIQPTFSTCFGAPFFPRPAAEYAELLMRRIEQSDAHVYLVNTGWTGGPYGTGQRFSIPTTRAVVTAILSGEFTDQPGERIPGFEFDVPKALTNVDSDLLTPRNTWENSADYDIHANRLIAQFNENFMRFKVSDAIRNAGPVQVQL